MTAGLLRALAETTKSASVMVLTVVLLRLCFQERAPRRVFCLLWDAVLVRLLILAEITSPVSVWRWFPARLQTGMAVSTAAVGVRYGRIQGVPGAAEGTALSRAFPLPDGQTVLTAAWLLIALLLAGRFLWNHLRSCPLYAASLPCGDAFVQSWLDVHPLRRPVQVRTSDRIAAPLTYGVRLPVILLPSGTDWTDRTALSCVLGHEYQHIRRFDALRKALLAAALCLHWFNPLAWVMYLLASRDMELACDEAVLQSGVERERYAMVLLGLEERRSHWSPCGSHFSRNALEERIRAIMKKKHLSMTALAAVLVAMGAVTTAFAFAAPSERSAALGLGKTFDVMAHDVAEMIISGSDGERLYSVDGGETWMSEERYQAEYGSWGDDWQVEWWTYDEYKAWLEEEKLALQDCIGSRAWTNSDGWFTWDQKKVDETIAMYEKVLEEIKNGALYSKTILDRDGNEVEDTALASGSGDQLEARYQEIDISGQSGDEATYRPAVPGERSMQDFSDYREVDLTGRFEADTLDSAALLRELKAFGIGGSEADGLTYRGQRIRVLVDGVPVGDNGYSIQYIYTDDLGTVDAHTLRSVIHNPDGSYNPMGELTGVVTENEKGFDSELIDCGISAGSVQATTTDIVEDAEEDVGTRLEPYKRFGLRYQYERNQKQGGEMQLHMSWNGKPVHSLFDTETGVWFANNLNGSELDDGAVDLETVYQAGKLCGLQEIQPESTTGVHGHARSLTEAVQTAVAEEVGTGIVGKIVGGITERVVDGITQDVLTAVAEGNSDGGGKTFEEIFAQYVDYGLTYHPRRSGMGTLTYQGERVKSFADLRPDGGAFSYSDSEAEEGIRLCTVYDRNGNLTGLRAD